MNKIRQLRWQSGAVLPERIRHDTLSARENDYFNSYNGLLSDYFESVGLDLTSDLEVSSSTCFLFSNSKLFYFLATKGTIN